MKKYSILTAIVLAVALVISGCSAGNLDISDETPSETLLKTDFRYSNGYVYACLKNSNGDEVYVTNRYLKVAQKLYLNFGIKKLKQSGEALKGKGKWISADFYDDFAVNKKFSHTVLKLYSNNVLIISEDEETLCYKTSFGTFSGLKKFMKELKKLDEEYYSVEKDENDMYVLTLSNEKGTPEKSRLLSKKPRIMRIDENLLEIRTGDRPENYTFAYYDRKNDVISNEYSGPTDYRNGYVCSSENKQIQITNIYDEKLLFYYDSFDKKLSDVKEPFVSLKFYNDYTVYAVYYCGSGGKTAEQYARISDALNAYKIANKAK